MKSNLEYRRYDIPIDFPALCVLEERDTKPKKKKNPLDSLHFHNHLEINYCFEGEGVIVAEGQTLPYREKTVTILAPNVCHATLRNGETSSRHGHLFVDVERFLQEEFENRRPFVKQLLHLMTQRALVCNAQEHPGVVTRTLSLLDELRTKKAYWTEGARGLLLSLLVEIARVCEGELARETLARPPYTLVILEALNYISTHYAEEIKIATLAEKCHMSQTHFRRIFQEIMCLSPLKYLNMFRIDTACQLLKNTTCNMEIIAQRVGYRNMVTFERNFRQHKGESPLQWRRKE